MSQNTNDLVPVKTKYPARPPSSEPRWVHLEWIQMTAVLAMKLPKYRHELTNAVEYARHEGNAPLTDETCKAWQMLHHQAWNEVVPLFDEVRAYFPLEEWSKFKHIRTPHDAERDPIAAVTEWERVRDYALDALAKLKADAAAPNAPATIGDEPAAASVHTKKTAAQRHDSGHDVSVGKSKKQHKPRSKAGSPKGRSKVLV